MNLNLHGIWAIYRFEMARSLRTLWQSLVGPVLTTSLYFIVFGGAIGSRMQSVDGVSYGSFIVPGLIMLSLLTQSVGNASIGIYFPKFTGTIFELLSAPISSMELVIGYVGAAATKSVVIGAIILVSVQKSTLASETLSKCKAFAVNLLAPDQAEISNTFARPQVQRKESWDSIPFKEGVAGAPLLKGTAGAFTATVRQVIEAGDRSEVSGAAAQEAARFAARDYGVDPQQVSAELSCVGDCSGQRSIRVRVSVGVDAPLLGWVSDRGVMTMTSELASWGGKYE